MSQLELLAVEEHFTNIAQENEASDLREREATQREVWGWLNWTGPTVGGRGSVDTAIVARADGEGNHYCYMAPVVFIEEAEDGAWIAEITYSERLLRVSPQVASSQGIRVRLEICDIAAPQSDECVLTIG